MKKHLNTPQRPEGCMSDPPFRVANYRHQQEEWDAHKDADARALLWQMRTGKSKAVIDVACYRFLKGDIQAVLILAPNGVHVNWVRRQLPPHTWETVPYIAHAWQASEAHKTSHTKSLNAIKMADPTKLAVLSVNSESIIHDQPAALIRAFLKKYAGKTMLIVDESHDFRSPSAKRTKRARALKRYCNVRRILTGTPVSNSPLAAFSQFELLEDEALGFKRFDAFKAHFAVFETKRTKSGNQYPQLVEYVNLDELQASMAKWASVVLRKDVDDMPELLMEERTISLSLPLSEAYNNLLKSMIFELESGAEIETYEGGARLIKLQQVLSGFVIDSAGDLHNLAAPENDVKMLALLDEIANTSGKIIVWCKFREDIRRVVAGISAAGYQCVEYHGAVLSQAKRQQAIEDFNNVPTIKVFVGQPKAGGQGLDLSVADSIIWYSHTFDLIERDQANERATQIGGKTVTITDFVVPGTIDEYVLDTLATKRSVADELTGQGFKDKILAMLRSQLI